MTLAKAFLEIFCSQASYIGLLLEKKEREDNSVMYLENFTKKVNQVIYTLDTICELNNMTKRCLRYFVHKLPLDYIRKIRKGDNSVMH